MLAQIARGEKVAVAFRHLGAAHVEEFPVHPVPRERPARRALGLRDFIYMVRKNQIDAAGVDVERLYAAALRDLLERHRGAFEMPAGPAAPERRIPRGAHRLVL